MNKKINKEDLNNSACKLKLEFLDKNSIDHQLMKKRENSPTYSTNGLEIQGNGILIDYSKRNDLSKGKTRVISNGEKIIGCYSFHVRNIIFNNEERDYFYIFDYYVSPEYRCKNIAKSFNEDVLLVTKSFKTNSKPSIYSGSMGKLNATMQKVVSKWIPYTNQTQYSWIVKSTTPISTIPNGYKIKMYMEDKSSIDSEICREKIISRWTNVFKNYQFSPCNFQDFLTKENFQLLNGCFVVELESPNGQKSEASISLWNQDKIHCLNFKGVQETSHNQMFGCYSKGVDKDLAFRICLQLINNYCFEILKVNVLFIGIHENDPCKKYFNSIEKFCDFKPLTFGFDLLLDSQNDVNFLTQKYQHSTFSDPRDYGGIMLYPNEIEIQDTDYIKLNFNLKTNL